MSVTWQITREEWRFLRRDRVAVLALVSLLLLASIASLTAWEQRRMSHIARTQHQAQVDQAFQAQPDRHPHRMVHYGHFVFRPLSPMAAFDPGIDAYTGNTLFLEGHRQNSPNFGDVRQSSLLLRFGQLTPAFVLQVLAPLLLVFIGHGALTRERESGTWRVLLAQGVRPRQIVAGKLLALIGVAVVALLPALVALLWIGAATTAPAILVVLMAVAYAAWLLVWCVGVLGLSACLANGRDALMALLAVWVLSVVMLPRLAPEMAALALPLPTRYETDMAVTRDLAALGNSHNPDDPYFTEFRKKVLIQYGVDRVEDLPVNYKGLVSMEGERLSSTLFERYATDNFERQTAQLQYIDALAWFSPVMALRRLSMAASGSDLHAYRRFVEQAEQHRYRLVQSLNKLQAEKLSFAGDRSSRDSRIERSHWHAVADFQHEAEPPIETMRRSLPAATVLLFWLMGMACLLVLATRRLGRTTP